MTTLTIAKATLRNELKIRLKSMSTEERQRQSSIVIEKVLRSPHYQVSKRICIYLSMDEEVSTTNLLKHILESGKMCFIPRYTQQDMEMLHLASWQDFENLPLTKWNIRQPSVNDNRGEALSSGGLDLVIVPGLGFTIHGHRIGRGKGYYDRYLLKCAASSSPPTTIALAFQEQIVETVPSEETDIKMHHVFYPTI